MGRSRTAVSRSFDFFESLEHRVLFDTTMDTGFGWKITYPAGVSIVTPAMVGGHLLIHENITDTRSNKPLFFERAPVWTGREQAQFFALEIEAENNTGGASNKFQLQLVDFGDFVAGSTVHPRWAHFHGGNTLAYSNFSNIKLDTTTATGQMQIIELSSGSVANGSTFSINGGAHPETGLRLHMGADYPSNSFSLFQALYHDTQPDQFEANDSSNTATNLGSVSHRVENALTLHLKHGSSDVDYYKFTASATGTADVKALFSHALGNVDIQVLNSGLSVLASGTSTNDDEAVNVAVTSGATYYVKVFAGPGSSSQRNYDLHIDVTPTPAPAAPEINLYRFDGTQIPFVSTDEIDIGSIMHGAGAGSGGSMQFRVRNDGGGTLTLGTGSVPNGFIVEGLASSLGAGEEDIFTVRLDSSKAAGTYNRRFAITNNDPDEGTSAGNTFGLHLRGAVTPEFATVRGRLFRDNNRNGVRDTGESYLANWRVFYDADRDGRLDAGELVSTTDSQGRWSFEGNIPAGTNRQFRVLPPTGSPLNLTGHWRVTTPSSRRLTLNLSDGRTLNNRLFGVKLL